MGESLTDLLFDAALEAMASGDYSQARTDLIKIPGIDSQKCTDGTLEFMLGECAFWLGTNLRDKEERAHWFSESIGYLKVATSKFHGATSRFEYLRASYFKAASHWVLGQLDQALECLNQGDPLLNEFRDKAEEKYRWYEVDYHILHGDVLMRLNRFIESVEAFQHAGQLLEGLPENSGYRAEFNSRIGAAEHYNGNDAAAVRYLEAVNVSDLKPDSRSEHYFNLLRLYTGLRRYRDALATFDLLCTAGYPDSYKPYAYHWAAIAHLVLGNRKRAEEMFATASSLPGPDWIRRRSEQYLKGEGL